MKTYLLLLLLFVSVPTFAQKGQLLEADDPITELWIAEEGAPILDGETVGIIGLDSGKGKSMLAMMYMEGMGFACPTNFVAYKDGNIIRGINDGGCIPDQEGNEFEFECTYVADKEELHVVVDGTTYVYTKFQWD